LLRDGKQLSDSIELLAQSVTVTGSEVIGLIDYRAEQSLQRRRVVVRGPWQKRQNAIEGIDGCECRAAHNFHRAPRAGVNEVRIYGALQRSVLVRVQRHEKTGAYAIHGLSGHCVGSGHLAVALVVAPSHRGTDRK